MYSEGPYRLFASAVAGTAARSRLVVARGLPTATAEGYGQYGSRIVLIVEDTYAAGRWTGALAVTCWLHSCA